MLTTESLDAFINFRPLLRVENIKIANIQFVSMTIFDSDILVSRNKMKKFKNSYQNSILFMLIRNSPTPSQSRESGSRFALCASFFRNNSYTSVTDYLFKMRLFTIFSQLLLILAGMQQSIVFSEESSTIAVKNDERGMIPARKKLINIGRKDYEINPLNEEAPFVIRMVEGIFSMDTSFGNGPPTHKPTLKPSTPLTPETTTIPTSPAQKPTSMPTPPLTPEPTPIPTPNPTPDPTPVPTSNPTPDPTPRPTEEPTESLSQSVNPDILPSTMIESPLPPFTNTPVTPKLSGFSAKTFSPSESYATTLEIVAVTKHNMPTSSPLAPSPMPFHAKTINPTNTYASSTPNIIIQRPTLTAKTLPSEPATQNPSTVHVKTLSPTTTYAPSSPNVIVRRPSLTAKKLTRGHPMPNLSLSPSKTSTVLPANPTPPPMKRFPLNVLEGCERRIPCRSRPTLMIMRLIGGDCTTSMNTQRPGFFICSDFDSVESPVHIVITDILGENITYFRGTVELHQDFILRDYGNEVEPNMNVTIYSSENRATQIILQTMVFHSSCSEDLFSNDIFGSIQLVGFTSYSQNSFVECQNALLGNRPNLQQSFNLPSGVKFPTDDVSFSDLDILQPSLQPNAVTLSGLECGVGIRCEERPTQMIMRYTGGQCSESINVQSQDLFYCGDYGIRNSPIDDTVHIVVKDIRGRNITYFDNRVSLGQKFLIKDVEGNQVRANMNVTIFSQGNVSTRSLLQTLIFHTSCSQNLFSNDTFGGVQILGFTNTLQNVSIDCFESAPSSIPSVVPTHTICGSRIRCESRPIQMTMRFIGGSCSNSVNIQSNNLFHCEDYAPTEGARRVIIFVSDIRGGSIIYFNDTVNKNQNFILSHRGELVRANMNVTIYSADTTQPKLLQTMVFHTSCSQNLFSNDIFGSVKLMGFTNSIQRVTADCTEQSSISPSGIPLLSDSMKPSPSPSSEIEAASTLPSFLFSEIPTIHRSFTPSNKPSEKTTMAPSDEISLLPSQYFISEAPSDELSNAFPSQAPTKYPAFAPSSEEPMPSPIANPSPGPTIQPTPGPALQNTPSPTDAPTSQLTPTSAFSDPPSLYASEVTSTLHSENPTYIPSQIPTQIPSDNLSHKTTHSPLSTHPSEEPLLVPTMPHSESPSKYPSSSPSNIPSDSPNLRYPDTPSKLPTTAPIMSPIGVPSIPCPCTIEVDAPLYQCGDPISISFEVKEARKSDWIGVFPCEVGVYFNAMVWQWSCGSPRCNRSVGDGYIVFDQLPKYNRNGPYQWPIAPYNRRDGTARRCFKAVYLRDGASAPYPALCESKDFMIMENDSVESCQIY